MYILVKSHIILLTSVFLIPNTGPFLKSCPRLTILFKKIVSETKGIERRLTKRKCSKVGKECREGEHELA